MGACIQNEQDLTDPIESEDEDIKLLVNEWDEERAAAIIRYGKGHSKYPKSDYQMYPSSPVVQRVMCNSFRSLCI